MATRDILYAAAGGGAAPTYIEDVFSTWLYTGTGANLTINNGIDLAGKGGMTWFKGRNTATSHALFDTNRGAGYSIYSNAASAQSYFIDDLSAFNSNGFTLGDSATSGRTNASGYNYVSWTFRKQPKFFDVVTWSGTDSAQTISHNLGSVPGMIIVKDTNIGNNWIVYHRSLNNGTNPETRFLVLNTTAAQATSSAIWNNTAPTSTQFTVGAPLSASGGTYVAYLFAHDAGGFGLTGADNVISCGSFTGLATVNLGYEPQYVMVKRTDSSASNASWYIFDNMRGFYADQNASTDNVLAANLSNAEFAFGGLNLNATGFQSVGFSTGTFIYMAIRRGPMATPTSGTQVYASDTFGGTAPNPPGFNGVLTDLAFYKNITGSFPWAWGSRLQGAEDLDSASTRAAAPDSAMTFDYQDGFYNSSTVQSNVRAWMFRRAPGFFDIVCYTATGSGGLALTHNLGAVPEMMIIKGRSGASNWPVYHVGMDASPQNFYQILDDTGAKTNAVANWNNTMPTATQFTVGGNNNASGYTYVAYLFATVAGVSKVGSYTGTGSTQTINAGLPTGARFVLIKRTDSTGDWWTWDTARGMVAGTDPRLALNSTAAQTNANWVYTATNGFQIVTTDATVNASGGSYIYLAIA